MKHLGRRGGLRTASLVAALACAAFAGCSDDDGSAPAPTATGGAAATRTATRPSATNTPGQGNPTATRTTGAAATATPTADESQPTVTPNAGQPTNTPGGSGSTATVEKFISSVLGGLSSLGTLALPPAVGLSGQAAIDFPPIDIPMDIPPTTTNCLVSGQQTFSCTTSGGQAHYLIHFVNCDNSTETASSLLDGDIELAAGGNCFLPEVGNDKLLAVGIDADVDTTTDGKRLVGNFDVTEQVTIRSTGVEFTVEGTADTNCTGQVGIQTVSPLFIPKNADCGTQGELVVDVAGARSSVVLTSNGGFDIDEGDNGSVDTAFASCEDSAVDTCD